jgi:purine-binding chemotaxis protein CheW
MEENKTGTSQFLTFILGKETYGVEITKIREILTYPIVTILPSIQDWVKGVINLRGEVTPIIDLRMKYNTTKELTYTDTTIIIAVITSDNRMLGIVVDKVSNIENFDETRLQPAPEMGTSIGSEYLKGLIQKDDGNMIVIMDIDRVLAKDEMELPEDFHFNI